jgi:hypothetical protein
MRVEQRHGFRGEIVGLDVTIIHLDHGERLDVTVDSGRAFVVMVPDEPVRIEPRLPRGVVAWPEEINPPQGWGWWAGVNYDDGRGTPVLTDKPTGQIVRTLS